MYGTSISIPIPIPISISISPITYDRPAHAPPPPAVRMAAFFIKITTLNHDLIIALTKNNHYKKCDIDSNFHLTIRK